MSEHLVNVESIRSYFESLSDPRREGGRKHLLGDVVLPQLKMEFVSGRLDKSLTGVLTHEFQPSSLHT